MHSRPLHLPIAVVDGQPLSIRNMREALEHIESLLKSSSGFALFTLNLDHLVKRRENAAFRAAYADADLVTADGWPVVALARRADPSVQRTTGADLVLPVCRLAGKRRVPVFLFGSTAPVLLTAARELEAACPGLEICGREAPPFDFVPTSAAAREAARRIAGSGARLCFVALGAPKQEVFADFVRDTCPSVGFICVGAALDFIAGTQKRAPRWTQRSDLEWAWRLALSPRRLGSRYAKCGFLFLRLLFRATRKFPAA